MKQLRHLILDMDGVLWHGSKPLTDLPAVFERLERLGVKTVFATNNASKSPQEYIAKFASFGAAVSVEQIVTSGLATVDLLRRTAEPAAAPVYVIGTDSLRGMLAAAGFRLLPRFATEPAAAIVVVGFNPQVEYEDFAVATIHIRQHGARFVGCNPDPTFPSERGQVPGNGSLIALLRTATDVTPEIVGKPEKAIFEAALRHLGPAAAAENTAMVGDRLSTDILGGRRSGLPTILLLSGVSTAADLARDPEKPDYVFDNIDALVDALEANG